MQTATPIPLSRPYSSRRGAPIIDWVAPAIFTQRFFSRCMQCSFCHDRCCEHGADVDLGNVVRLMERARELEAYVGIPRDAWFTPEITEDGDFPGRLIRRTQVRDGACVFLNRSGRGCRIHAFCVEQGLDYHEIKPSVCWMFPVTVDGGLLHPSAELRDRSLVCLGDGPTLYRSQREELLYNFGAELVAELDALEHRTLATTTVVPSS